MKYIEVGKSGIKASNVVMGCMRLKGKTVAEAEPVVQAALESGINFFDHADVYGRAEARGGMRKHFR